MQKPFFILSLLFLVSILSLWSEEKTEKLLKDFETYAEAQRKDWNVQGMAIAIVKDGKVILSKGYGQRGLNDKRPVDENTIFQIGSLSKAFTSALIAIGVDKGWVKWDDKVIAHVPSFHLADAWATAEFQVQDLLAQRSGLPPYAGDSLLFLGYSHDDILDKLRFIETQSSFRSQYAYQNILFVVASRILERKSSQTYPQLLQTELFGPLEMTNSSATLKDYLSNENRAGWIVHLKNGSLYDLKEDFDDANWNYEVGPAGGINSSVKDMANWMILQTNQGKFKDKQLISTENMKRMSRPMIFAGNKDNIDNYYGLGWAIAEYSPYPIIWHNGATLGVYNFAAFIPQEKLGIVILTNGRNTSLATGLAFQFFDMYYGKPDQNWSQKLLTKMKERNKKTEDKIENPTSPLPLSRYTGKYHSDIFGDIEVKEEDKQLSFILGKKQQKFTLKPWDRDIFTAAWPTLDLDEGEPMKVLFTPDDKGNIDRMLIDVFTDEGEGSFDKVINQEKKK